MKKKILILMIFSIFFLIGNIKAKAEIGITQELYINLCGVWDYQQSSGQTTNFSWGIAKWTMYRSIVIDLGDDIPRFYAGDMGRFNITKIYQAGSNYYVRILFRDNNEYDIKISFVGKNKIIFHKMPWFDKISLFGKLYGPQNKYYKISGPVIKYYKNMATNLRLRKEPAKNSEIIRLLDKGERLLFLKKGKIEQIGDIKGTWVKVLTNNNEIGWCFDFYLK